MFDFNAFFDFLSFNVWIYDLLTFQKVTLYVQSICAIEIFDKYELHDPSCKIITAERIPTIVLI